MDAIHKVQEVVSSSQTGAGHANMDWAFWMFDKLGILQTWVGGFLIGYLLVKFIVNFTYATGALSFVENTAHDNGWDGTASKAKGFFEKFLYKEHEKFLGDIKEFLKTMVWEYVICTILVALLMTGSLVPMMTQGMEVSAKAINSAFKISGSKVATMNFDKYVKDFDKVDANKQVDMYGNLIERMYAIERQLNDGVMEDDVRVNYLKNYNDTFASAEVIALKLSIIRHNLNLEATTRELTSKEVVLCGTNTKQHLQILNRQWHEEALEYSPEAKTMLEESTAKRIAIEKVEGKINDYSLAE